MPIVGIDLGTTNSLVAVFGPDGPHTIANELGDHLTPSAVALAKDGSVLVGRAAKDRLVTNPGSGRAFFKRDMGTATTYEFGRRRWTPTECSALVLRELVRVAQGYLKTRVTSAVITVPAYFHEPQRKATAEAATIAGLEVAGILSEPTAAALAFGHREAQRERRLLVFDLGGGTFDVTVLETFEGIVEVKASAGDGRLGGEDYTESLMASVLDRTGLRLGEEARAKLRQRIEVLKRRLSEREEAFLELEGREVRVTRTDFERATSAWTGKLRPIVRRCLRDARLEPADLDEVLMVGGASRMHPVLEYVREEFGREPNRTLDPDRVVALGAAVQAARTERSEQVQDLVMTDVCPHSLGVEVAQRLGRVVESGYYLPLLDRNAIVPVSRAEALHTMEEDQDEIVLNVFQGESRRVADNTFLGTLRLSGLRHRPGQKHPGEIEVRFTFDANGILEVDATVRETGVTKSLVLESRPGALTKAQLEEAVRRMQPLKVHPRDLLPNRARLERAYRLFSELTGEARAALTDRIAAFERALAAADAEAIGFQSARLDQVLRDAYEDEGEIRPARPEPEDHRYDPGPQAESAEQEEDVPDAPPDEDEEGRP